MLLRTQRELSRSLVEVHQGVELHKRFKDPTLEVVQDPLTHTPVVCPLPSGGVGRTGRTEVLDAYKSFWGEVREWWVGSDGIRWTCWGV